MGWVGEGHYKTGRGGKKRGVSKKKRYSNAEGRGLGATTSVEVGTCSFKVGHLSLSHIEVGRGTTIVMFITGFVPPSN